MIYRNNRGITFTEIIVSAAIISIILLGSSYAVRYIMHAMSKDRQDIKATQFSRVIIEELKANCVPKMFLILRDLYRTQANDWEAPNSQNRKFPSLRAKVDIHDITPEGHRDVDIKIRSLTYGTTYQYNIKLIKNPGLGDRGVLIGRVINYVTDRGIPDAIVQSLSFEGDGTWKSCNTRQDGTFTLNNVLVGKDVRILIEKRGSAPNNLNYDPGYYNDPDLIDQNTLQPKNFNKFDNPNQDNDQLMIDILRDVVSDAATDLGDIYMAPLGIIRGWVRHENETGAGVGRFIVTVGQGGNFINNQMSLGARNSMHPYYNGGLTWTDYYPSGWFHFTTRDTVYNDNYSVEDVNVPFSLAVGEYVFFNIRPGKRRHLYFQGRIGSHPTVTQYDPPESSSINNNFAWGYLGNSDAEAYQPRITVLAKHIFTDLGGRSTGPLMREELGHHFRNPVTDSAYRYYQFGACAHVAGVNLNPIALAVSGALTQADCTNCGVPGAGDGFYTQPGWNNYETLVYHEDADYTVGPPNLDNYPTCFVAHRRGGIVGRIVDQNYDPISGITVCAKAWGVTWGDQVSYPFNRTFDASCPTYTTDTDGMFYFYNMYGSDQENYASMWRPLPNWNAHIDAMQNACQNDTTVQDYALLRITDGNNQWAPRLVRPFQDGHSFPSWHPANIGNDTAATNFGYALNWNAEDDDCMTDLGDIHLHPESTRVTVTGRIVTGSGANKVGVQDVIVNARSIFGLAVTQTNNNLLGMPNTVATDTTGPNGYFQIDDVMPNYDLVNDSTAGYNDPGQNIASTGSMPSGETSKTMRCIEIFDPNATPINNVRITGDVTDLATGSGIDSANVYVMLEDPPNSGTYVRSLPAFTVTGSTGYFDGTLNVQGPANAPVYYYEHLPNNLDPNFDPYVNYLVGYDSGNRIIDLGEIQISPLTLTRKIAVGADLGDMSTALWYQLADTMQLYGSTYKVGSGSTVYTNPDPMSNPLPISLLRNYRIRYFGRVVDSDNQPLANSRLYIRWYSDGSAYGGGWLNHYTDANGYWGDWSPRDGNFPNATGRSAKGVIRQQLSPISRGNASAGDPYWCINIIAAEPNSSPLNYDNNEWHRPRSEPDGLPPPDGNNPTGTIGQFWDGQLPVSWDDDFAVHIPTLTAPVTYIKGQ